MYNPPHEIKEVEYRVAYKAFVHDVWDGKLSEEKIMAPDGFTAVGRLMINQHPEVTDVQVVSVNSSDYPNYLEIGQVYTTLNGTKVKMISAHNLGTGHETMVDQFGTNRYSRRPGCVGRCTGASPIDEMNIKLSQSWFSKDFDREKYDKENSRVTVSRVCPTTENHRNLNEALTHVAMDYRGYTIYGLDGVWGFMKNPHSYLGMVFSTRAEGRFDAQKKIDEILDGPEE